MFLRRVRLKASAAVLCVLSACGLVRGCGPAPLDQAAFETLYTTPLAPPESGLQVYHLGHSLVGRDMPAMLAQLSPEGHAYGSQLGWGATLRSHWEPDVAINGFDQENTHAEYRAPREALRDGVDAFVMTEMVEIKDAIQYHDSPRYVAEWVEAVPAQTTIYFYETWHRLDGDYDWLERLDEDLGQYWEGEILRGALARLDTPRPVYVIPGGQVMAAFVRRVEAQGGIGPIADRQGLFRDEIHFNDYGAYLMALTHYAVLYGRAPVGLPHALLRHDGSPADDPGPAAARAMQEVVWEVVRGYAPTGVATF